MSLTSYEQAHEDWKELVADLIPKDDETALAESWNDYTDRLCKDGGFTAQQYHFCPAWDDSIMRINDLEHVLDGLGFKRLPGSPTEIEGVKGKVYRYQLQLPGAKETVFDIYLVNPEADVNDVAAAFLRMDDGDIAEQMLGKDLARELDELVDAFY